MIADDRHSATVLVLVVLVFLFTFGCLIGTVLGWLIWR